jgi:hypothetical protein
MLNLLVILIDVRGGMKGEEDGLLSVNVWG